MRLRRYLLVMQAALQAFAHGANDIANAAGPMLAIVNLYVDGAWVINKQLCLYAQSKLCNRYIYMAGVEDCVFRQQLPVLLTTGFLVALGVVTLGRKVVQTVSIDMAQINYMRCAPKLLPPHIEYGAHGHVVNRGWTAAFAATIVVMAATVVRVPLSTIHCQVGAVAAVGVTAFGLRSGSWDLFFRTLLTWIITFPACALLGAGICWVLNYTII